MFFDSTAWPPPPDGPPPPRRGAPRLDRRQERSLLRAVAFLLLAMVIGPFAGSSVANAVVALFAR